MTQLQASAILKPLLDIAARYEVDLLEQLVRTRFPQRTLCTITVPEAAKGLETNLEFSR